MMEASPRETLPKNLCPVPTSSSIPKVSGLGCARGGAGCGAPCCADAGTTKHSIAARPAAARRDATIIETTPGPENVGRRFNRMLTRPALDGVHVPSTRMLSAPTMTAQRQETNRRRRRLAFVALLSALAAAGIGPAARAATTERLVTDRFTGLAIGGFDPVAFFTDAR